MVGENNKILTVSYGTFSCTLEGFDDPFSTMRGIAEYFRDLAADDRYFGAEPPTPDVEMLQKIAEKEVQNRVEKKINDGGVILRQVADGTLSEDNTDDAEEASDAPFTSSDASIDSIAEAADAVDETGSEETPLHDEETVADEALAEAAPVEASDDDSAFEDDEDDNNAWDVDNADDSVADDDAIDAVDTQEPDADEGTASSDDADDEDDKTDEDVAPRAERPVSTPLEIFAERLEDITAASATETPATADDLAEAVDAADIEEPESAEVSPSFEDKLARIQAAVAATPDFDDDFEAEADPVAEIDAPDDAPEAEGEDDAAGQDDGTEYESIRSFEDDASEDHDPSDDDDAPAVPEGFEVAAQVVTLKRNDLVSDDAETDESTTSEDGSASEDDIREVLGDTSLSDEDEQDLAATLARIEEAEVEEAVEEAAAEVAAEEAARAERTRPISRPLDERDENEGVSRLLEEADHQFQDDESSRRRSAIAHLKAAVAATKADDLIRAFKGGDAADEEEQSAYRDDLNRVVKPQSSEDLAAKAAEEAAEEGDFEEDLPEVEEQAVETERPAPIEDQPAPLMLVSEQRVDGDTPSVDAASIRPKRIMAEDEIETPRDTGFVAFAEDMGAKDLPELLEAAAAYAAFVENEPHFSRPQLMRRVEKSHLAEDFSREAGLRTFGQLLRQGRLQKLKRGQFTVSSDSRFNPDSRIAGE